MTDPTAPRVLVSLATYNEAGNLAALIGEIHKVVPAAHVLVIDDNSPDGTGRIADDLAAELPGIHVMHRPAKLGLGTAVLAAMRFAVGFRYEYLINMDADFSHPPSVIPQLITASQDADIVIASRYVPGGGVVGWPVQRKIMSWGINTYVRLLLGLKTRDNSGSFRCYRVELLRKP